MLLVLCLLASCRWAAQAQELSRICNPIVSGDTSVVTPQQREAGGDRAQPPLFDHQNGFAWPDTPMGVVKVGGAYEFFGSDGGLHGGKYGNGKYGSATRVIGTLDQPLGAAAPIDVAIRPNPDPHVNPAYRLYDYIGGGPVYAISPSLLGAGDLLMVYHAEIPTPFTQSFYSVLGLAASRDGGLSWTDLGEIIRVNQPYGLDLDGFDIGDPTLVISPDRTYFQIYFRDWLANGSTHWENTITLVSVARASVASVIQDAFGSPTPHAAAFHKFYRDAWQQSGIGGLSTDLNKQAGYSGELQVAYDNALQRYVMIIGEGVVVAYSESADGMHWTQPILIRDFRQLPDHPNTYVVPVGLGSDPSILGDIFYVYYTRYPTNGGGWNQASVRRFTVTCA
jgi:hypothetical protein